MTSLYGQSLLLKCDKARVDFVSEASLEMIKAHSSDVKGILDIQENKFAFKVNMLTFNGFNSPLQREHFFENFMDVDEFPESTYIGKLLTPISNLQEGKKSIIRTKGILTIHGKSVERIIEVNFEKHGNSILFEANFIVPLVDHNIRIPRIVDQKISNEIQVKINGVLK